MRLRSALVLSLAAALAGCTEPLGPREPREWPTPEWPRSSPEAQGMGSAELAEVVEKITSDRLGVHSLLIVRHGYLVIEAYFPPYDGARFHDVASVTKSVTTTLVGISIDRGLLSDPGQRVLSVLDDVVPGSLDERKRDLTIGDLAGMTTGMDCGYGPGEPELVEMIGQADWTAFALGLPMRASPGREFSYCSPGMHLLSGILDRVTGQRLQDFAREVLFDPLGIDFEWWSQDPQGLTHGWGDLRLPPRDMAKLGLLFLHGGRWAREQVVSSDWVREATRRRVDVSGSDDGYGYGWWIPGGDFQGVFEARGRGGQFITVWPAMDLVLVMTGSGYDRAPLVPLLAASMRASHALPEDPAGAHRLARAIESAQRAPQRREPPPPPEIAGLVSGRLFDLPENDLHISTLGLRLSEAESALLVERDGVRAELPIGFDGLPRVSSDSATGIPVSLEGEWTSANSLRLDYEETAGANHFELRLSFARDASRATLEVTDPSGLYGPLRIDVVAR